MSNNSVRLLNNLDLYLHGCIHPMPADRNAFQRSLNKYWTLHHQYYFAIITPSAE